MFNKAPIHLPHYRKRWVVLLFTLLSFCIMETMVWDTMAWAHKVTIFAWVEGDMIHTQSKFSGGKRAKNSNVIVYDLKGNKLLEGKTDDNGEFSFKIPSGSGTGLRIVLNASMGHMAEWTIPSEEMGKATGGNLNSPSSESVDAVRQTAAFSSTKTGDRPHVAPSSSGIEAAGLKDCNYQRIQDMIDSSLDKKLTPVMDMLIKALNPEPTIRDIIGGIGYIVGLVGLSLYFMNRNKPE